MIVLAPHFIGLNMGGIRVAHEHPGTASIYSRQKNPVLDAIFLKARTRFGNPHLVSRQEGLRSVIRVIKTGKPFYFLPDMDFGMRDAIFSPFFGVPTATINALPRLARLIAENRRSHPSPTPERVELPRVPDFTDYYHAYQPLQRLWRGALRRARRLLARP